MTSTLSGTGHSDLLIRKSRFIGCVQPIRDRAAAQVEVGRLRQQHPGAAHVCWALMAGGHSAAVDDGEPGGTAGRPMLEVLRHQGLDGVLATAVRYYGGIQLGTGGLVRAYTDCVVQALTGVERQEMQKMQVVGCDIPYAFEGVVRRGIEAAGADLLAVAHAQEVSLTLRIAERSLSGFVEKVNDAAQGRVTWWIGQDEP